MNVLQSFTIQTLKVHKKWALVTIIGIIISTAMLSAVATFSASILDMGQREMIQDTGKWMACFKDVPIADAEKLKASPLCSSVMVRKDLGFSALSGSKNIWKPYLLIRQYDAAAIEHFSVKLTSGRLPENDREIVISSEVANNAGVYYSLGDSLTLTVSYRYAPTGEKLSAGVFYQETYYDYDENTGKEIILGSEYLVPTFTQTYEIVGFFSSSLSEESWDAGYTCFSGFSDSSASPGGTADIYIWSDSVSFGYYDQVRDLGKSMGYSSDQIEFNGSLLRYYAGVDSDSVQQTLFLLAAIIIAIIMTASVSLIYNAFSIAVSERTRHLGLLASAGATRKQKRYHVLFEGFLVGAISIPLGILFGILGMKFTFMIISPLLSSGIAGDSVKEMHTIVSVWTLLATVLLASLTVFVSVLIPAFRASRIMPIDAIRQTREIRLTPRSVRTHPFIRKLFGFEAELAMKNFRRNRRKYRATTVSLVISLVLFLTVSSYVQFGIMASTSTAGIFSYDIFLSFNNIPEDEQLDIKGKIADLPGTEKIVRCDKHYMSLILNDEKVSDITRSLGYDAKGMGALISSYDDDDFAAYARSVGVDPEDYMDANHPKVILINATSETNYETGKMTVGNVLNVSQGDTITAEFSETSKVNEENPVGEVPSADFVIGKVTEEAPVGSENYGFQLVNMILPSSTFTALVEKYELEDSYIFSNPAMYILAADSQDLEVEIADIVKTIPSSQVVFYNVSGSDDANKDSLLLMGIFVYGFITLIGLICIANIFNTVTTNIALRQKEFAMLRSIGMTPKSFIRMVRFESIFFGMKALVLGLPISILLAYYLYRQQLGMFTYDFSLPWKSYIAAILLVFALVFTTMMYSVSRVNKQNIIDALKIDTM